MRRRRNRIRRQPNWKAIFGLLLVLNLILGIFYSRLTAISRVRVEGAQPGDQKRIAALLTKIHDQPALQVNRRAVETWLMQKSAVNKAEMTRNIFGRALVSLEYRRAVAVIDRAGGAALSRDGSIFQSAGPFDGLPTVNVTPELLYPSMTIAGIWRVRDVARLAAELADLEKLQHLTIYVMSNGGLCLNIGSKFAVQLGPPEQLDKKIDFLRRQLDQDPELVVSGKTLVLVRLDRPVFRTGVDKGPS